MSDMCYTVKTIFSSQTKPWNEIQEELDPSRHSDFKEIH